MDGPKNCQYLLVIQSVSMSSETVTLLTVSDDKFMPTLDTFNKMTAVARECEIIAQKRKLYLQIEQSEREQMYQFVANCLMYKLYGTKWITALATDPQYQQMKRFYIDEVEPALKMHRAKTWKSCDEFETTLFNVVNSLESLHKSQQPGIVSSIITTGWSLLSYIPVVASVVPAPILAAGVASALVSEIGIVKTFSLCAKAAKLGIDVCMLSERAFACVFNITSNLI